LFIGFLKKQMGGVHRGWFMSILQNGLQNVRILWVVAKKWIR